MPNTTNEKILMDANAAIQRGDIEGFLRHCTENTTWTFVGERTLRGKEEVRRWMVEAYKEPPVFQVDRMLSGDDHVVALGQISIKNAEGSIFLGFSLDEIIANIEGNMDSKKPSIVVQPLWD